MEQISEKMVQYCLEHQLVQEENAAWLKYGLEKRLSSFLVAIPFLILATILSDFLCAASFLGSFYLLRSRINGFHAKSALACFFWSIGLELLFILIIRRFLNSVSAFVLYGICVTIILLLAPYDHCNMHYTQQELSALKPVIRKRICFLTLVFICGLICDLYSLIRGMTMGVAMAALLLCLAYIIEGSKHYEHH